MEHCVYGLGPLYQALGGRGAVGQGFWPVFPNNVRPEKTLISSRETLYFVVRFDILKAHQPFCCWCF